MEETAPRILEIGLLLLLAALLGWGCRRAGLPAVVGYLATGLLVSPFTPGYVANRDQLQLLADVGVVLLLFEVGIEINPLRLARARRGLLVATPAQLLLTGLAGAGAGLLGGLSTAGAALVGLSLAMSSSVVVVNITRSRRRTTDPATEDTLLAWSVVQDLVGVGAALVVLLAFGLQRGAGRPAAAGLPAFIGLAVAAAWLVPRLLRRLRAEHDLFLLVSVASGLLLAGLGSRFLGVPLALAAFVAGLAITESPDAAEARRRILPFRDLFAVLFFVSLGTLLDPRLLARAWPWLAVFLLLVAVAKVGPIALLARVFRLRARSWQLALGLGQVGEFSYVLASLGLAAGVLTAEVHTALVASVVLTIATSSVLVRLLHRPAAGAFSHPVP